MARRDLTKKFLTPRMKDRLKDEASNLSKRRKKDGSNVLLSVNLDKLVQEESKTNSRLDQVCRASDDVTAHC